jgi:hypothetical protein
MMTDPNTGIVRRAWSAGACRSLARKNTALFTFTLLPMRSNFHKPITTLLLMLTGLATSSTSHAAPLRNAPLRRAAAAARADVAEDSAAENGLMVLVDAGNLIADNAALHAALDPNATLTLKRRALADPDCRTAFAMVRQAATMAMWPPENAVDFHGYVALQRLSQLLAVEQYVYLAEGRTGAAIDTLEETFRLFDALRGSGLAGGLMGANCDQRIIQSFAAHSGQWSADDCERILRLVDKKMMDLPDPARAALEGDRRMITALLKDVEAEAEQSGTLEVSLGNDTESPQSIAIRADWSAVRHDPAASAIVWDGAYRRLNAVYDWCEAIDPYASRPLEPPPVSESGPLDPRLRRLTDGILEDYAPRNVEQMPSRFARREVLPLRLLAVHALIRRYRWEFNKLPVGLSDLRRSDLTTDPYTGAPLRYVVSADGSGYELSSAGSRTGDTRDPAGPIALSAAAWK